VAILNDYESRWSIQYQRHHQDFDYVAYLAHYYRALAARNVGVDILSPRAITEDDRLTAYKIIIAPALIIIGEDVAAALRHFVVRGGHLVLTLRTGMKDGDNALLPARQPGPLAELAGIEVEEYYALRDSVPVQGNWFEGVALIWAERLKLLPEGYTQVIARYGKSNGWLDDQVAITVNVSGKGLVYYIGAYLDPLSQRSLVDRLLKNAGIRSLSTPEGVEARLRVRPDGQEVYFLINHAPEGRCVPLPWSAHEHLGGSHVSGELELAPYGVALLTQV
jgi:beta-galactosidase